MIKELEDYNWFPGLFRRYQAEYIGTLAKWTRLYTPLVPELQELINENQCRVVHDLCSGSGIPAIHMQERLTGNFHMVLSDKFPSRSFPISERTNYLQEEFDVLGFKPQPGVCYTMYNAFHHFTLSERKKIVKNMAGTKCPFLIAEILTPGAFNMIKIIITTSLLQLLAAPFVKPFSLKRLFFTYIIPVNILTVTYDGMISVLHSSSVNRYRSLLSGLAGNGYKISVDQLNNWKGRVVCIKGDPIR